MDHYHPLGPVFSEGLVYDGLLKRGYAKTLRYTTVKFRSEQLGKTGNATT